MVEQSDVTSHSSLISCSSANTSARRLTNRRILRCDHPAFAPTVRSIRRRDPEGLGCSPDIVPGGVVHLDPLRPLGGGALFRLAGA